MKISEVVSRAALAWVKATHDAEATEVTSFRDRIEGRGNCPTCGWDQVVVDIEYKTPKSQSKIVTYEGDFGEFICELDFYDRDWE